MRSHLTDDRLADALEGREGAEARRHLDACRECSDRLDEARSGLERALSADVPEPPPLYWETFRRQVGHRISGETPVRRATGLWLFPALATAAAVLIAVVIFRSPGQDSSREAAVVTLPAWSALPPAEEDEGLDVLQAFAAQGGALDAALPTEGVAGELSELTEEESQILADALQDEMAGADTL